MPADYTYRLKTPHRPGQLATVAGAIADVEGVIGDIDTLNLGRKASIREVTIEVRDDAHAEEIAHRLKALEGVEVIWFRDRALIHHEGGKLVIEPTHPVESLQDMRDIYTPGVARACRAIEADPDSAARYTMMSRTVAICTNGTRVLGLGNIGPLAAMPVMEGKAVFYRRFAGISAMPILIDCRDPGEFVETVRRIAPGFGGIHLEDIEAPACFEIEEALIDALDKPVMHDDVHGTAVVSLAAAIVACRHAGLMLQEATVGQLGLGAAGFGIAQLMVQGGVSRVLAFDPNEASHERARAAGIEMASQEQVMRQADVVVATTGKPGLIEPASVRKGQVILALSNPDPEINPDDALAAGAAFAGDGTMVNNVLGYPGIFRGALEAGAEAIDVDMKLAAAWAIAGLSVESELVPDVLDRRVHERVADAVRQAAEASGAARPERARTF